MPKNSAMSNVGGMLDDLKSRLGFNKDDDRYDDYDDYDDRYDNGDYDEYSGYDDYADNGKVGGFRSASPYAPRFKRDDISSSLVSFDDVKLSTPLPDRLTRDPLEPVAESYAQRTSARAAAESASYASARSAASYATASTAGSGAGYTGAAQIGEVPSTSVQPSYSAPAPSTSSAQGAGAYDPYEAYSSATPSAHAPVRSLAVIKPVAYGDVERVARAVKSGDVVVLAMRNTPDELSKRILDFSFGVASALDANVECPAEKVFAIARGNALTESEKTDLRNQGVL